MRLVLIRSDTCLPSAVTLCVVGQRSHHRIETCSISPTHGHVSGIRWVGDRDLTVFCTRASGRVRCQTPSECGKATPNHCSALVICSSLAPGEPSHPEAMTSSDNVLLYSALVSHSWLHALSSGFQANDFSAMLTLISLSMRAFISVCFCA
jgi:hypothetical protein